MANPAEETFFDLMSVNQTEEISCDLNPHDYLEIKFFLISGFGTLIGLFGIFGNFSTVVILTRPSMRSPNNMFLTALAIFDSCLIITAFFIYGMEYIIEYFQAINLYIAWLTYLRFAFALSHISQTGSVYTTLSVTVERFLAVCYPRVAKRFCTSKASAFTILGVTCFAILFNSTKFFELEVYRNPICAEKSVNWQAYVLYPSELAKNPLYGQIYSLWLTNIIMVFLPFLLLLTLNFIIASTIRKSLKSLTHNRKSQLTELREKSREASVVLVVIVLIFLICNFCGFFITLLEHVIGANYLMDEYHAFYTFSREATNFLAIVNSSINFVIYIIFGKDFRKELVVIYSCGSARMVIRMPSQDKFSVWRQISRRRMSSWKQPVFVHGIRLLRIASFNKSLKRTDSVSSRPISSCSDANMNVPGCVTDHVELLANGNTKSDTNHNRRSSSSNASNGLSGGRTSASAPAPNGFLTVPSPRHLANGFCKHRRLSVDSVDSLDSADGIHFV